MGERTDQRWPAIGQMLPAGSWTTQQLADFLSVVSSFTEESDALRGGVERAAEAVDSEIAALVRDGRVDASIGFAAGSEPVAELIEAAAEPRFQRDLRKLGLCTGMSCPVANALRKQRPL